MNERIDAQARNAEMVAGMFTPFSVGPVELPNRIVMPGMGVHRAEGGVPGPEVADYYRRRAEGGAGLIITEGTYIDHPVSGADVRLMHFHGDDALAGWANVVDEVHAAGGRIFPQLWHVGLIYHTEDTLTGGEPAFHPEEGQISPSGYITPDLKVAEGMTQDDIDAVVESYGRAASTAQGMGFDGIEVHAAHGYLIDQFFWDQMNRRTDQYGGDAIGRTRFAVEVIEECRRRVGPDYPISLRISNWKLQDYAAKFASTPQELEELLQPLVAAGVDIFHCSQRRYWEPQFDGSDLNLAGWVKKISGLPTITVGCVGLVQEMLDSLMNGTTAERAAINELCAMFDRGDFDLIAVGRSMIANANWAQIVQRGALDELNEYTKEVLFEEGTLFQDWGAARR